jgi:prepilin-type N-terminal cleavage/methylation domain-containing protein
MMSLRTVLRRASGFTLIELMVVGAVLLVLLALAGPSIRDLVGTQRLQNVQAQVMSDLQFARGESVRRQLQLTLAVSGNADQSCYVLYIDGGFNGNCNCLRDNTSICTGSYVELRTLKLPASTGLTVRPSSSTATQVNFFPVPQTPVGATTPRYSNPPGWQIELSGGSLGTVRTALDSTGRATACSPGGTVKQVPACP